MASNADRYIGVEIGGTKLQVVLGDGDARLLDRVRLAVDPARGAAVIRSNIEQAIARFRTQQGVAGVGVGFGGPIDIDTGRVSKSYQVEGWTGFDLRPWFEQISGLPTRIDNDANTAALAEARLGAGRDAETVFYVTLGSGVGGGLVQGGRLFHGARPGEAEIGFCRLTKDNVRVEDSCAGWSVDRKIREQIARNPAGALAARVGAERRGEARFLARALAEGDADAAAILDETAGDLAFGLSHVVHLMNPHVIILGGGLSLVGEPLRAAVARHLPRFLTESYAPGPPVRLAQLGEDVVAVGALLLAQGMG